MKTKEFYIIDNLIINIDRYFYESNEMYTFRINYIYNEYKKKENKSIENIIYDSIIKANIKYNKVSY